MNLKEILQEKREEILKIAGKYGAHNIRLFGSSARGTAGPESDIDFLIELEPGRSLLDHAALLIELEKLLGCGVDVVTEKSLKPRIREQIIKEAVSL